MRILIVEDEPAAALLLSTLLAPFGDCETAPDGARALELLEAALAARRPFRLVCLDMQLGADGTLDGNEVLARLRAREEALRIDHDRRARVLVTTVIDDPSRIQATFAGQCDAYLVKPVTRDRLIPRLRDLGIEVPRRPA